MLPLLLIALVQAVETPKPIESLPPLVEDAQAVSPDHKRISISTQDEGVWVIDIATKTVAFRVAPTKSVVEYVAWTRDSAKLGLLHRNADIEIVDAASGAVMKTFPSTSKNPVEWEKREIHFAAGGTVIVAALGGPPTDIFNCDTGERIAQIANDEQVMTTAMVLDRDGDLMALGDSKGLVTVWGTSTATKLHSRQVVPLEWPRRDRISAPRSNVHALAFDPTGSVLAIGGGDCTARLWEMGKDEQSLREFSHCDEDLFDDMKIGCVQISPDATKLLSTSYSFWEARVWDIASGEVIAHCDYGGGNPIRMPAWFSSDGAYFTTSLDLKISRIADGTTSPPMGWPAPRVAWWSSDGDYAWTMRGGYFVVRKIPDEEPVLRIPVREK
ncbi:MAG: WD40 repeat domain-containing protein [Planctomycetes bacterium]|nr:WD40 repeat domain-containing protein [Planctomycetota bacterium]